MEETPLLLEEGLTANYSTATPSAPQGPQPKQQKPKRTTVTNRKLTLFPPRLPSPANNDLLLPHTTNPDLKNISSLKSIRNLLPRLTAYCTANKYNLKALSTFLSTRRFSNLTSPRLISEVLYTPFTFSPELISPEILTLIAAQSEKLVYPQRRLKKSASIPKFNVHFQGNHHSHHHGHTSVHSAYPSTTAEFFPDGPDVEENTSPIMTNPEINATELTEDVRDANTGGYEYKEEDYFYDAFGTKFLYNESTQPNQPTLAKRIAPISDLMFFEYGVVVMWGLSLAEEKMVLSFLKEFEEEELGDEYDEDDVTEKLHYYYTPTPPSRLFHDIITLLTPSTTYMTKLTISHALAQSSKLSIYETRITKTISSTQKIPKFLEKGGKIPLTSVEINKKIGELFIMRIDVNLVSNVLDTPDLFWNEVGYEKNYLVVRGYLEISQRVEVLNQRVSVISDLLDMLKEHQSSYHGESLEWIVIWLITIEIIVGVFTLTLDYMEYRNGVV